MNTPSRNAPCPCGSGRKYKLCHLREDEAAGRRTSDRARFLGALDERLVDAIGKFVTRRFGTAWFHRAGEAFTTSAEKVPEVLQLLAPFAIYHARVDGRTPLEWYLAENGETLGQSERAWLEAQRASWLSVWEVLEVRREVGLQLRDLLTGETRFVHEVKGSRLLTVREALLGRVVESEGCSLLCGIYPRGLPPGEAAEVVWAARRWLRVRSRPVPAERLRDEWTVRILIGAWEAAIEGLDKRPLPELRNTDGEEFVLTTDLFSFDPSVRATIAERLAELAEAPEEDAEEPGVTVFTFTKPGNRMHASWDNTIVGNVWLAADELRLETNSTERAEALRERVEQACAGMLRHLARKRSDPWAAARGAKERGHEPEASAPELAETAREAKQRYYEDWLDEPIPALGGRSPRQAAKRKRSRPQLDTILKEIEYREQRLPETERVDVRRIREDLGIGD
jgi:hypothetical protein